MAGLPSPGRPAEAETVSTSETGVHQVDRKAPPTLLLTAFLVVGWHLLFRLAALFEVVPGGSAWFLPAGLTVAFVWVLGWRGWPLAILAPPAKRRERA